ncbi:MAG: glycosyltransferase family 2 protein [Gemmatimonadaceae bacterium]
MEPSPARPLHDEADAPPTTPNEISQPAPIREVVNEPVLQGRDSLMHVGLTAIGLSGLVLLGISWLQRVWTDGHRWLTGGVTLLVVAHVAIWFARWMSLSRMRRPKPVDGATGLRVAAVTTFVASQEPLAMLELTLDAMVRMSEAHDTWVLDEEDDPAVQELCARLGARHFSRARRPEFQMAAGSLRAGTKHGNYNAWLAEIGYASYDVLAMFDPDHVPDANYLQRTLGYFRVEDVGFVQPPQVYYNQKAGLVARGAAEESYGYYSSHLMASYAMGHTVVIGSHGLHRLSALHQVGGLPAHDAEDLYLTILYRAAGWRGVFVPEVLALGMTPTDWAAYLGQQLRWARSLLDLKLRVLPRMSRHLPLFEKLINLAHGAFYMRALLIPAAYLLLVGMLLTNDAPAFLRPRAMITLGAIFLLLGALDRFRQRFYLAPQYERGVHWRAVLMQFAKWPVFIRAVLEVVSGRRVPYLLTSKRGRGTRSRALAPVQISVAALMALVWWIGTQWHYELELSLTVSAWTVIAISLGIAWSESLTGGRPYREDLYRERRPDAFRAPR